MSVDKVLNFAAEGFCKIDYHIDLELWLGLGIAMRFLFENPVNGCYNIRNTKRGVAVWVLWMPINGWKSFVVRS